AKIYVFPKGRSYDLKKPARLDTGDVRPSSPDVRRVAMDALGRKTCGIGAYGQAVWSCPANAGDKPVSQLAGDGGKKAGSPGRSRNSRNTIAQGVPCDVGVPVLASRASFLFCTQGSGCVVHPAFPAPSCFRERRIEQNPDACAPRGCGRLPNALLVIPGRDEVASRFAASRNDDVKGICLDPYLRFPLAKCFNRNSASTSTRAGRGPPGGVTQCSAPSGCFQPFRITSTAPDAIASPTMNSGRSAIPSPAISAGMTASPLLARNAPPGRTLACSPAALV